MTRRILGFAALLLTGLLAAPSIAADFNPVGQWEVSTGESRYKISYCGGGKQLCAKLTWLREDARTDDNMALLNKTVVKGAPADVNSWEGTLIYDGKTYDSTVTQVSANAMRLHSCSGIFCQSFELKRI